MILMTAIFQSEFHFQGETALHIACERGLVNLIIKLLDCGANPNISTAIPDNLGIGEDVVNSSFRLTPILTAILNRHDVAVRAILDYYGNNACTQYRVCVGAILDSVVR